MNENELPKPLNKYQSPIIPNQIQVIQKVTLHIHMGNHHLYQLLNQIIQHLISSYLSLATANGTRSYRPSFIESCQYLRYTSMRDK